MDHHYTSHTSQPMSYTTTVYQTGAPATYHTGTSSGLHYSSTADHGHTGTNPLSYSYTQEVRGSHESPHKSAAPAAYTNYTTTAPTSYTQQAPGGYTAGLSGSYTNFTTSNIGAAQPQGYTNTSTQPQSYTTGAYGTTSYSQAAPASYTTNVGHVDIGHHATGESVKRAVQSLPAPSQPRQSVLSPYRHSMYPEFELVEDLPDRSNLLTSINNLLQKSPARESLLTPPSEVIIKRDSVLSPAEINVQRLLKEKYEDGSIYEGESRGGKQHGRGRIIFRDGRVFEGEFKDGRAQGRGVYYHKNGQICYEGEISDSLFDGRGTLKCEAPAPLQGPFDPQNFGNLGSFWTKYEGEFKGGKKHGKGTLYLTSGEKFTGEFKNDRVDGKGTFESRDGRVLQGEWDNNVLKR